MPHQRPKVSALIVLTVAIAASWMPVNRAEASKSPGLTEFETGVRLFIGHKPRQAIRHLTQSILLDPFNSMAYVYRGQAHLELEQRTRGKYKEAIADYNTSLKFRQEKDKERIMEMRAQAYDKIGRKDLAAKDREYLRSLTKDWGSLLE